MDFAIIFLISVTFASQEKASKNYDTMKADLNNGVIMGGGVNAPIFRENGGSSQNAFGSRLHKVGHLPNWNANWAECINQHACDPKLCQMYMPSYLRHGREWKDSDICSPEWHAALADIHDRMFSFKYRKTDVAHALMSYPKCQICAVMSIINDSENMDFGVSMAHCYIGK